MACDKPNGDCTNVSPCANTGCGCSDSSSEVILPKCQDVSLTPGVFTHATVVVNEAGCISAVVSGEPELYTPDECCVGSSGTGAGAAGPRGPKGDPGAAATVDVVTVIDQTSTGWTVQNIGTPSAAIFQFTGPSSTGSTSGAGGATGEVGGLEVIDGVVISLPSTLLSDVEVVEDGLNKDLFIFEEVPTSTIGGQKVSLNLDALVSKVETADEELQTQLDALTATVAEQNNEIVALTERVVVLEAALLTNFGINGDLAWSSADSEIAVTVQNADGETVGTVGIPANGAAELPPTDGQIYYVYRDGVMVGAYSNC